MSASETSHRSTCSPVIRCSRRSNGPSNTGVRPCSGHLPTIPADRRDGRVSTGRPAGSPRPPYDEPWPGSSRASNPPATPPRQLPGGHPAGGWRTSATATPLLRRRPPRPHRARRPRRAAAAGPSTMATVAARGRPRPRARAPSSSRATSPSTPSWRGCCECTASIGELRRMTQFKDKSARRQETARVGLFTYPVLWRPTSCSTTPTGAGGRRPAPAPRADPRPGRSRFNPRYGETFVVPEAAIPAGGGPGSWTSRTRCARCPSR